LQQRIFMVNARSLTARKRVNFGGEATAAKRETKRTITSRPVSRVLSGGSPLRDGHSSGTPIAGRLEQPTRAAGLETDLGGAFKRARPPLFGLAPGGVCRAADVAAGAVRSYRTLSPLPGQAQAVCFLWHFPWGRPRRPLAATVSPWSPDFPPPDLLDGPQSPAIPAAAVRPAGRGNKGAHGPPVKGHRMGCMTCDTTGMKG